MKKAILALSLLVCALLLTGCAQEKEIFPEATAKPAATQNLFPASAKQDDGLSALPAVSSSSQSKAAANSAVDEIDWDAQSNPAAEEDWSGEEVINIPMQVTSSTAVPTVRGEYAGATPVPIDPIDKPTPTPLPALVLADPVTYDATRLRISFSAPGGWIVDAPDSSTYIITNPDNTAYQANVTIRVTPVDSNYTTSQLKSEVSAMISSLKSGIGFRTFSSMKADSRTLMEKAGIYNDFYGTTNDGVEIYGRVHVTCIEKKLYSVTLICPRGYWESYKTHVYNKIRSTMMITR